MVTVTYLCNIMDWSSGLSTSCLRFVSMSCSYTRAISKIVTFCEYFLLLVFVINSVTHWKMKLYEKYIFEILMSSLKFYVANTSIIRRSLKFNDAKVLWFTVIMCSYIVLDPMHTVHAQSGYHFLCVDLTQSYQYLCIIVYTF